MGNVLTARNAVIRTATAEIKALTIEGKQVTMAVFRQLLRRDLIDRSTGELLGVPWGLVNYFWADCGYTGDHLHVVWQDGDELRRDCVPSVRPGSRSDESAIGAIERAIGAAARCHFATVLHGTDKPEPESWLTVAGWQIPAPTTSWCSGCFRTERDAAMSNEHRPDAFGWDGWGFGELARVAKVPSLMNRALSPEAIVAQLKEQLDGKLGRIDAANGAWARSYALVAGLDQLFIAV